jgi:indolepyruvate ferredoxin oxidoreductase beta subunit
METKAITIAILAMGGEGGGVLADWITDLAEHCGFFAQTTSVPGVAQRTGATIYYLEMFPEAAVRAAGQEPVLALMPVPGELDIVIASELMEAGRAIDRGLVTPDRTTLITSTHRVYSMTERTAISDGRVDAGKLLASGAAAKRFVYSDFAKIAAETGSVISAVLFGALAATEALPFSRAQFEDSIRRSGVGVEPSLTAFAAGFQAAGQPPAPTPQEQPVKLGPRLQQLAARIESDFPPASHAILLAGFQRLADYQDVRYADEYLNRLEAIRTLDRDCGLLNEAARHLALWMSYEDTIRVADLKTRRTRFERVHREVRGNASQVIQIREFLHPRVEEISDTLPAGLGRWLLRTAWARKLVERFTKNGMVVQTTSLSGFMMLYGVAGLRRFRRKSLRFTIEQQRIGEWLAQVERLARNNYALAVEIAECPQLLKG